MTKEKGSEVKRKGIKSVEHPIGTKGKDVVSSTRCIINYELLKDKGPILSIRDTTIPNFKYSTYIILLFFMCCFIITVRKTIRGM